MVAVLALHASETGFFTREEKALLTALAEDLSFGLTVLEQERQRQEGLRLLQEANARLDAIFQASPVAIWVVDPAGKVILWNPAAAQLFGWQAHEISSQMLPVFSPKNQAYFQAWQQRLWKEDGNPINLEIQGRKQDGAEIELSLSAAAFRDTQGQVRGAVMVAVDITARKQAEARLQQQARELDRLVRERTLKLQALNKELEAFAYSISHDLKAPLRAISGFAQIIARRHRNSLNNEGQRYIDYVVQGSERMATLIDALLAYARLGRQALTRRPVALQKVLQRVIHDLTEQIAATGARLQLPQDLPVVPGDITLLEQIFTNLLGNALKYRRPGVIPEIHLTWKDYGDYLELKLIDNGIGIPPEHHEKIFNVFQRLHSEAAYPGTGIGLAIVKKAVELLKGRVWVESIPDRGTTFAIKLPKE